MYHRQHRLRVRDAALAGAAPARAAHAACAAPLRLHHYATKVRERPPPLQRTCPRLKSARARPSSLRAAPRDGTDQSRSEFAAKFARGRISSREHEQRLGLLRRSAETGTMERAPLDARLLANFSSMRAPASLASFKRRAHRYAERSGARVAGEVRVRARARHTSGRKL